MGGDTIIKEFCAENFTHIPSAVEAGANRIELCDNLTVGGTTPSYGVIQTTLEYCEDKGVDVMVMIRPRGGDFEYNPEEVKIMCRDILSLQYTAVDGVVLGAVKDGWIDEEVMEELLYLASDMEVTFHMAFDEIDSHLQTQAIDWLADRGVKRILTHGGSMEKAIEDNILPLKEFIQYANNRITILPGGGININNVDDIVDKLGVDEVHGTKIVDLKKRGDV